MSPPHVLCTCAGRKEPRVITQLSRASVPGPPHLYFIQLPYKYSIFHFPISPLSAFIHHDQDVWSLGCALHPNHLLSSHPWPLPNVIYRIFLLVIPGNILPAPPHHHLHMSPRYILHSYYKRDMDCGGCWRELKRKPFLTLLFFLLASSVSICSTVSKGTMTFKIYGRNNKEIIIFRHNIR